MNIRPQVIRSRRQRAYNYWSFHADDGIMINAYNLQIMWSPEMILTAPLINPPRGCPCHQLEKAPHWTGTTKGCHQLWFSGQNQKYFFIQHNFIANLYSQVDWYFVLITTKSWLSIQMLLWTIWNLHIHFSIPLKVSIEEKLQINFGAKTGPAGGNLRPCSLELSTGLRENSVS